MNPVLARDPATAASSLGVPDTHEEHPGSHRGLVERYLALLPRVAAHLSRAS